VKTLRFSGVFLSMMRTSQAAEKVFVIPSEARNLSSILPGKEREIPRFARNDKMLEFFPIIEFSVTAA
jgi:hypothetical protein